MKPAHKGAIAVTALLAAYAAEIPAAAAADPAANRKASSNYEAVVRGNPGFRANREHVECDGIESLDLKAQCLATFERPAPIRPTTAEPAPPPSDLQHPRVTITNGPVRNPDDD